MRAFRGVSVFMRGWIGRVSGWWECVVGLVLEGVDEVIFLGT